MTVSNYSTVFKRFSYFYLAAIPALSALAYFIYREQRESSIKLTSIYSLGYFIVFSLLYSLSVQILPLMTRSITEETFSIFIDFLHIGLLFTTTILFISFIIYSIWLVNDDFQMKRASINIVKRLKNLKRSSNLFIIEYNYNYINQKLESVFQILQRSIKYNNNNFNRYFDKTSHLLESIWTDSNEITISQVYNKDTKQFNNMYKIILNNLFRLLTTLHETDNDGNLKSIQSNLRHIVPFDKQLNHAYFRTLKQIALYTSEGNSYFFHESLSFFEQQFLTKVETNNNIDYQLGFLLIYQSLLKNNISKEDIENVTTITYSLQRIIFPKSNNQDDIHIDKDDMLYKMEKSVLINHPLKSINSKESDDILNLSLFILFQATLKSIETGSYAITGQLIKRIVTDYTAKDIQYVFEDFYNKKGNLKIFTRKNDRLQSFNDLIEGFSFNINSYDYCIQKLVLLLLGQEAYTIENNIIFSNKSVNQYSLDFLNYLKTHYIQYVINKINNVGPAYGLLFLQDQNYLQGIIDIIEK